MTVSELLKCLKALEEDGKGYYKVLFKDVIGLRKYISLILTYLQRNLY